MSLGNLPSTNFRIVMTQISVLATTAKYVFLDVSWEPSWEWLTFLAIMSGIDMAQYWSKRSTYDPTLPQTKDIEDAGIQQGESNEVRHVRQETTDSTDRVYQDR